jgi:voltage-gated potassium channel
MTARMLNPTARIISRMTNSRLKPKLLKAGATSVVSPNAIGALRMASEMIRPEAVDFLDNMLRSERGELRIHQIKVNGKSSLVGKSIMTSGLRDQFNLLLLGVRRKNGEFEFRPPSSFVLEAGMTLIVMGDIENINRAREAL